MGRILLKQHAAGSKIAHRWSGAYVSRLGVRGFTILQNREISYSSNLRWSARNKTSMRNVFESVKSFFSSMSLRTLLNQYGVRTVLETQVSIITDCVITMCNTNIVTSWTCAERCKNSDGSVVYFTRKQSCHRRIHSAGVPDRCFWHWLLVWLNPSY